jgi:hypothetical protein
MQKKSRTKGLILTVVSLLFIWGLFSISSLLLNASNQTNLSYFPSDSEVVIRVNGKELIKEVSFNLLEESKDKDALTRILNFISKKEENQESRTLGIDVVSDVGIFLKNYKNGKLLGVLVNINSNSLFEENSKRFIDANTTVTQQNNVGLILTYISPDDLINQSDLKKIGVSILAKENVNPFADSPKKNALIEIQSYHSSYGKGMIEITGTNHEFQIESELDAKQTIHNNSSYCLKPKGLHVSCAFVPDNYLSVVEQLFPINNKERLPKIKTISWNYQGMNIQEGGSHNLGFFVQPMTDLLIEFDKPFHLNQHINYVENFNKWGVQTTEKGLKIGQQTYVVDSLNPTMFFVGVNASNLQKRKNPYLLNIEGDVNSLLKISGSESITTFVDMIFPAFSTSQDFFKTVENTSIRVTQQKGKIKINGKLKFKKDKFSYTECVRLMLALKGY